MSRSRPARLPSSPGTDPSPASQRLRDPPLPHQPRGRSTIRSNIEIATTLDEDGYVYVVGRLDDVIITGGENVHPAEVENVLSGLPGLATASHQ
jgi:hypothetical protein